jgi:flagellar basal-body rod modification protein FlgD
MPTAIGAIGPASGLHGSVDSAMNALGGMDSEGFLKLLVAQLQYQSPLDPKDPGDLMTQTATLAQLDATQQLLAVQQRDLGLQQALAASGLIGREISGTDTQGQPAEGVVTGVRYTEQGPALAIGSREVLLYLVTGVRQVPPPEEEVDEQAVAPPDEPPPVEEESQTSAA